MPEETPLQKLRRLEEEERAGKAGGASKGRGGRIAAAGGGTALALAKGKALWVFLAANLKFFFLAFKLGPFLGTLTTMWLSVQVYSALYGSRLAFGFVALILVHELGHGAAAKALGLKVGAPIFIPFYGAVIALKEQPRSTWVECQVAAAGPAAGLTGALACALAATLWPASPRAGLLLALAHISATMNLFNLLPAGGLDGDRVTQPFTGRQWAYALAALTAVCVLASVAAGRLDAVSVMVLAAAAFKAWRLSHPAPARLLDRLAELGRYAAEADETTPPRRRAAVWIYCGLAGALACLAAWSGRRGSLPDDAAARAADARYGTVFNGAVPWSYSAGVVPPG